MRYVHKKDVAPCIGGSNPPHPFLRGWLRGPAPGPDAWAADRVPGRQDCLRRCGGRNRRTGADLQRELVRHLPRRPRWSRGDGRRGRHHRAPRNAVRQVGLRCLRPAREQGRLAAARPCHRRGSAISGRASWWRGRSRPP